MADVCELWFVVKNASSPDIMVVKDYQIIGIELIKQTFKRCVSDQEVKERVKTFNPIPVYQDPNDDDPKEFDILAVKCKCNVGVQLAYISFHCTDGRLAAEREMLSTLEILMHEDDSHQLNDTFCGCRKN